MSSANTSSHTFISVMFTVIHRRHHLQLCELVEDPGGPARNQERAAQTTHLWGNILLNEVELQDQPGMENCSF